MGERGISENFEVISSRLESFAVEIDLCIADTGWDRLAEVLKTRHGYFESILSKPVAEENIGKLLKLVQQILDQDAKSLSKIQDHKKKLLEHFLLLENGRRAINAYRDQK